MQVPMFQEWTAKPKSVNQTRHANVRTGYNPLDGLGELGLRILEQGWPVVG